MNCSLYCFQRPESSPKEGQKVPSESAELGKKDNRQLYRLNVCIHIAHNEKHRLSTESTVTKPGSAIATGRTDFQRAGDNGSCFQVCA